MIFKFLFLILLLATQAFALISSDEMDVKLLKIYDKNIVVLNRGIEDGIFKGDHIKLTNTEGFISRGICVKNSMTLSHWKIYRVVRPALVSLDDDYVLKDMSQSEIPKDLKKYKTVDLSKKYNDVNEESQSKALKIQQKRIAKFDLPNETGTFVPEVKKVPDALQNFLDRNLDKTQLQKDFKNINLSVYASPISWQKQNDQKQINYGFGINNVGTKYEFSLNFNKYESKMVDAYTETTITSDSTHIDTVFDINRITPNLTYFLFASYDQARTGDIYYPKKQYQGGILGLKYHIIDDAIYIKRFDFSYVTTIDYIEYDQQDFFTGETKLEVERNVRHSMRVRLNTTFSEHAYFNSTLWYKPRMDLDTAKIDWSDNMTDWSSFLGYRLNENVSFDFGYQYTNNIRQLNDFGLDPINQVTTINIRYDTIL